MQAARALLGPMIQRLYCLMGCLEPYKMFIARVLSPKNNKHTASLSCQLPVSAAAYREDAVAETLAKAPVQDPWKGPLPTAVRVPPQPPGHPRTPSQPEAVTARPQPEPRSTSSQAVPPAKQQPMPPSKVHLAASPAWVHPY